MSFEVVDKKRSILPCSNYSCNYILNSDGMAVIVLTNNMRNFCCDRHVHLSLILYGVNSMYKLVVDSNMMGIVTVIVGDHACKTRTANSTSHHMLVGLPKSSRRRPLQFFVPIIVTLLEY